jgi:preprotein translocase subunit YajC
MILLDAATESTSTAGGWGIMIIYIVVIFAMMYFMAIRPQKKQQKKHEELMAALTTGDYVLTTAGMYGTVIDITDDMVIVEFGNNKNCRIPMQKSAITEVEKAN